MDYEDYLPANDTYSEVSEPKALVNPNFVELKRGANFIRVHGSGQIGNRAINAITGRPYDIKIGSRDEDNLYKVMVCTGEKVRIVQLPTPTYYQLKTPLTLFFDCRADFLDTFYLPRDEERNDDSCE